MMFKQILSRINKLLNSPIIRLFNRILILIPALGLIYGFFVWLIPSEILLVEYRELETKAPKSLVEKIENINKLLSDVAKKNPEELSKIGHKLHDSLASLKSYNNVNLIRLRNMSEHNIKNVTLRLNYVQRISAIDVHTVPDFPEIRDLLAHPKYYSEQGIIEFPTISEFPARTSVRVAIYGDLRPIRLGNTVEVFTSTGKVTIEHIFITTGFSAFLAEHWKWITPLLLVGIYLLAWLSYQLGKRRR
jgi:hypothetical protein